MLLEYEYSLENPVSVIGEFVSGLTVNIELWVSGVLQTNIASSGCNEVDATGRYSWSTGNIPSLSASRVQYHYRMTSNTAVTVEGDFLLKSIEANDGMMPSLNNKDSYILRI